MKKIPYIYYISQGLKPVDHLHNIEQVCQAGCKIVQLRLKLVEEDVYTQIAIKAKAICELYGSKLIINDNINVALNANADGVHLGKNDISPLEVRDVFNDKIIGGTANTLEDCLTLIDQGVNYIGLGPYRFTSTKQNLSPILGLKGYTDILMKLKSLKKEVPIVGIGGILSNDFEPLFSLGLSSLAVSSLLTNQTQETLKRTISNALPQSFA